MIRRRAGMTLVEVLVTIAVTGMMVAAGTTSFVQIINHRQAIIRANIAAERGVALREMIHGWLYSGVVSNPTNQVRAAGGSGQSVTYINGLLSVNPAVISGDEVRFSTTAKTPLTSDSTIMRLFVDDDDNTPERGLTLEYRASTATPLYRIQLDTSITLITVEYRNTQTGVWTAATDAQGITPKGMRLTLFSSDSLNSSGIISLPIIVPMGANPTATPNQQTQAAPGGL